MAWFRKKPDPISDRARELNDEIARAGRPDQAARRPIAAGPNPSRVCGPTALPHQTTVSQPLPRLARRPPSPARVPPRADLRGSRPRPVEGARRRRPRRLSHYNDLGVRKYDLPALLRRVRAHFRGPSTTNPKLVSYLAAGGIQGLRPLRYREARGAQSLHRPRDHPVCDPARHARWLCSSRGASECRSLDSALPWDAGSNRIRAAEGARLCLGQIMLHEAR